MFAKPSLAQPSLANAAHTQLTLTLTIITYINGQRTNGLEQVQQEQSTAKSLS